MGLTVLYIAFGLVALWLLGEVLLQYKARLRWRLLAFVGFLGVVLGVLMPSVIVIGVGAVAFAVGQTYVTLSFRRGFEEGWAVNPPEALGGLVAGRRRDRDRDDDEPSPEISGTEERRARAEDTLGGSGPADPGGATGDGYGDDYDRDDVFTPARPLHQTGRTAAESTAVHEPQPLPDDTGDYGVYGGDRQYGDQPQPQDQYAAAAQTADPQSGYGYQGYTTGYDQQSGYGYDASGQQQYAAYSDPYIGTQTYSGYDASYGAQQQYGQQQYGQDQYAAAGYGDQGATGAWVPQQRTDEAAPYGGELPPEQQYPYQTGQQGTGYGEGYQY
jgi:hypothetical protein